MHRSAVVGAEWNQTPIRSSIMDTAPLDPFQIIIITVHEMHDTDEQGIPVKIPQSVEIL
jgi:hypothetical protein